MEQTGLLLPLKSERSTVDHTPLHHVSHPNRLPPARSINGSGDFLCPVYPDIELAPQAIKLNSRIFTQSDGVALSRREKRVRSLTDASGPSQLGTPHRTDSWAPAKKALEASSRTRQELII